MPFTSKDFSIIFLSLVKNKKKRTAKENSRPLESFYICHAFQQRRYTYTWDSCVFVCVSVSVSGFVQKSARGRMKNEKIRKLLQKLNELKSKKGKGINWTNFQHWIALIFYWFLSIWVAWFGRALKEWKIVCQNLNFPNMRIFHPINKFLGRFSLIILIGD